MRKSTDSNADIIDNCKIIIIQYLKQNYIVTLLAQ